MIDLSALNRTYAVCRLDDTDAERILAFCRENTQYYLYCKAEPTMEQIQNDLHIAPPGIGPSDKYYLGFFEKNTLAAVMDLIDGYPEEDQAFIGFFMLKRDLQGRNIGSGIIQETAAYLKAAGKKAILLGMDKENPQSTHFWKKNGFVVTDEIEQDGWTLQVAKKTL